VFTEAGLLSCALLPRNLQSQSNRAHFFWFLIALLLATAPGPIDGEDANPKQQCENVHKRREFAQVILPGLIGVSNQNDHAGDRTQGKTQPGQDPDNAHCPSGHGSTRPAGIFKVQLSHFQHGVFKHGDAPNTRQPTENHAG